jgi:hypothetical protein
VLDRLGEQIRRDNQYTMQKVNVILKDSD